MKKLFLFLLISVFSFSYEYYGAIAINTDTGATGYSYDYSSRASAERAALSQCSGNCEIALWFSNTCGAVAYSYQNRSYGWAWGSSSYTNERNALANCSGNDCEVVSSVCTTRYN